MQEDAKLFKLRQSIVGSPLWQSYFNDYNFSPFLSKPEEYIQAFASLFDSEDPEGLNVSEIFVNLFISNATLSRCRANIVKKLNKIIFLK